MDCITLEIFPGFSDEHILKEQNIAHQRTAYEGKIVNWSMPRGKVGDIHAGTLK